MSWTKLGSTSQLVPMPSRVTTWPVLPSVIVGNVGAAAARARSAEPIAAAAPAPVAAAVFRNRLRLPPHVPWDPSIVTTFPLLGSGEPGVHHLRLRLGVSSGRVAIILSGAQ